MIWKATTRGHQAPRLLCGPGTNSELAILGDFPLNGLFEVDARTRSSTSVACLQIFVEFVIAR